MPSNNSSPTPDQNLNPDGSPKTMMQRLSPLWEANFRWKDKLYRKSTYRALDMPDDMGDINVDRSSTGLGTLGVLGVAGATGLAGVGGAYLANNNLPTSQGAQSTQVSTSTTTDNTVKEGRVITFYEKDPVTGELREVTIPRLEPTP